VHSGTHHRRIAVQAVDGREPRLLIGVTLITPIQVTAPIGSFASIGPDLHRDDATVRTPSSVLSGPDRVPPLPFEKCPHRVCPRVFLRQRGPSRSVVKSYSWRSSMLLRTSSLPYANRSIISIVNHPAVVTPATAPIRQRPGLTSPERFCSSRPHFAYPVGTTNSEKGETYENEVDRGLYPLRSSSCRGGVCRTSRNRCPDRARLEVGVRGRRPGASDPRRDPRRRPVGDHRQRCAGQGRDDR